MNNDCPFCGSTKKENRVLKEGDYAYVIFSDPRLMPGHLLIIPKRHIDGRIGGLTREERDEIFDLLAEFQKKILEKIAHRCDIRQKFKPYVKESKTHVDHMHWHLYRREFKDPLYEKADIGYESLYEDLAEEEKERIMRLLQN